MHQRPLWCFWGLLHNGVVHLLHLVVVKEPIHPGERLRGFGKDHHSAYWPIETVNDAEENIPRLLVLLLEVLLHLFGQRDIASTIALSDLPCSFANNNQVVILVKHLECCHYAFRFQVVKE